MSRWARDIPKASSLQPESFRLLLMHARWARDCSLSELG
ncbi:hypothetical protein A2U01_0119062, partial [Trifolium medium]|nr:hypothetical protein [Trifolium medium]